MVSSVYIKVPVRPTSHDDWQFSLGVGDTGDVQRAVDDDLTVENAITSDVGTAASGDLAEGAEVEAPEVVEIGTGPNGPTKDCHLRAVEHSGVPTTCNRCSTR